MLAIAAIDHTVLRTSKVDDMLSFYCDVLGCSIERETSDELGLTQLRAGSALIDLVKTDGKLGRIGGSKPTIADNNLDHFCLQLKFISEQATIKHLQSHGIQTTDFEKRYGAQGFGPSLSIKDPEGNVVELKSQITPGSP